ncbi:MAG: DUF255 domain-containing protein [Bacteroidota bacterium]
MKLVKQLFYMIAFSTLVLSSSFSPTQEPVKINWLTWEEAAKIIESGNNSKKVFVDVYTDWCGWCKRMDRDTFNHPDVAKYMNENYLMVKLDAHQKEDILYKGTTFKLQEAQPGQRGYHELAIALLNGKMSFPTVIFLNEKLEILTPIASYLKPDIFYKIASFYGENEFEDKSWEDYSKTAKVPFGK